ncbi:Exocyst complex component 8 [Gryllus bimaculatus]|nr:Exocyst complex component 8 [Gryllus bimaculatus]
MSKSNMADTFSTVVVRPDFNPEKYVNELTRKCIGGQELQQQRQKIQSLADETSVLLKKNVYQNYMQFIETAKEISHLESEMYELSRLLNEQNSLLSSLTTMSLLGDKIPSTVESEEAVDANQVDEEKEEEERRRKLAAVLEKVEGAMAILEVPGRVLLHEGTLMELDPMDNKPIHQIQAYLLNDVLMLATWIQNSRGPVRYKFQTTYELGSLAVVNVRDLGGLGDSLFKLLAFPDTRVFRCSSAKLKREWLDKCDHAKKSRLAQEQQKRDNTATADRSPSKLAKSESLDSPSNPFEDHNDGPAEPELPEWLVEMPEDLDVCIAQRHFEDAYNLIERARDFVDKNCPNHMSDPVIEEIRRKLDARVKSLIEVLMKELEVSPDKSLQGGLRAARRAVRLLNQLGRSTQACDLFLKLCTSILKVQLKRVKREGATVLYVRQLGGIFFSNLTDMAREFLRAFPNSPSCASAFVGWAGSELTHLTSHLIKQVFMPQSSISTLAECVTCVRDQCDQLCELGIDLRYQLDGQLRTPLIRALRDSREKLVDAVKLRGAEDKWHPLNLQNKAGLTKFIQEMSDIGIASIHTYVTGECWINLTSNTVAFCKLYLALVEDCLCLATAELLYTIDEVLGDVFHAQLKHVEASLKNDKLRSESKFIQKNAVFLLDTLLTIVEHCYEEKLGHKCTRLSSLQEEYAWIKKEGPKQLINSSKPITKYSSSEYL